MKKRILSLLLLLTLAIGFALPASADTVDSVWNSDFGVLFTVTVNFHSDWGLYDDQYAIQTITGYRGSDTSITLPSVDIDGAPIQAVNDDAFQGNTSLTSVTIPSSITSIGARAFAGCSSLTSVTIPDSVVRLGSGVFSNCSSLTDITLPSGLAAIEQSSFFYCEKLTSIAIPSGVPSIGSSAFWGCSSLTSITIPASVTRIEYGAFMECASLADVYYEGTADQWAAISINNDQSYNDPILKANIHYSGSTPSSSVPTSSESSATPTTPAVPTAYATSYSILVDGQAVAFDAYALRDENGNDTNYLKLRDVAHVLNGSAAQFDVGWDAHSGSISITTGTAYASPNGSEMSTPFSGDQSYTENTSAILINGTKTDLSAITLTDANGGAYTYFKLRDLGQSLGFSVDWDAASGSIVIDTAKP